MPMGQRSIELPAQSSYLIYDQNRNFDLNLLSEHDGFVCIIQLPIETLHHFISKGSDELNFVGTELFGKTQYHHLEENSGIIRMCLHEMAQLPDNLLIQEAKKYTILADYFGSNPKTDVYKCPFLNQKENVIKIRDAKSLLIHDLQNTPTIPEIARRVGLNEYNLKTGFKEIYGKTIHAWIKDYKMAFAKEQIEKQEYQVAEIADMLGYTNISHFIEAFRKKYGITPKQYEKTFQQNR